jgi:hypothetical protein
MNEQIFLNGVPVIGFGELPRAAPIGVGSAPAVVATLPWGEIVASSVVSAAAGWALEEVVRSVRKKRR